MCRIILVRSPARWSFCGITDRVKKTLLVASIHLSRLYLCPDRFHDLLDDLAADPFAISGPPALSYCLKPPRFSAGPVLGRLQSAPEAGLQAGFAGIREGGGGAPGHSQRLCFPALAGTFDFLLGLKPRTCIEFGWFIHVITSNAVACSTVRSALQLS